jgi:hypothetical protein
VDDGLDAFDTGLQLVGTKPSEHDRLTSVFAFTQGTMIFASQSWLVWVSSFTYMVCGFLTGGKFLSQMIPCIRKTSSSCTPWSSMAVASFQHRGRPTSIGCTCLAVPFSCKGQQL